MDPNGPFMFRSICMVQALMFQFCTSFMMWHWILVLVMLYKGIVQGITLAKLQTHCRFYYKVGICIVTGTTAVPLFSHKYGPMSVTDICWINDPSGWRFAMLYAPIFIGILLFMYVAPSLIQALAKASRCSENDARSTKIKAMMVEHMVFAVYAFIVLTIIALYAINNLLVDVRLYTNVRQQLQMKTLP